MLSLNDEKSFRRFRHYSNEKIYELISEDVICAANGPLDGAPMVLYREVESGQLYTRSKDAFFDTVGLSDVKRFEPVD